MTIAVPTKRMVLLKSLSCDVRDRIISHSVFPAMVARLTTLKQNFPDRHLVRRRHKFLKVSNDAPFQRQGDGRFCWNFTRKLGLRLVCDAVELAFTQWYLINVHAITFERIFQDALANAYVTLLAQYDSRSILEPLDHKLRLR